ncbi:uncharacterized protein LOC103714378 [Phoenix dactylifera]|uniref:Uncharacterized protein LOC103714378 n=1 Tax=Phoenix dactylifera TaxID=42345 RepID=A0A8B7CI84_PHODC|nr:uncharacterized protein LOC103714378 [Phoenix dactylifera]
MDQRKIAHAVSVPSNSSVSARNLRKNDLGGVIFGCKHSTIAECLSKQLFGLPFSHFSYVRNIEEGLPLFLFNYSDRKLHGIYEAASRGQLNANSYAWTDGGAERTPFPAQVAIHIKMRYQPLPEDQFKKVLADNYYTHRHFWFELDHAQARALIALFKSSSYPINTRLTPDVSNKTKFLISLPATRGSTTANMERTYAKVCELKKDLESSVDMVIENKFTSLGWDDGDLEPGSSSKTSSGAPDDMENKVPQLFSVWEEWVEKNELAKGSGASTYLDGGNQILQEQQSGNEKLAPDMEMVLLKLKELSADHQPLNSSANECNADSVIPYDPVPIEVHENNEQIAEDCPILDEKEETATATNLVQGNAELMQVIKELQERTTNLEKKQVESDTQMHQLGDLVKDSGRKLQILKDCVKELEAKSDPSTVVDDSLNKFVEQRLGSEDVIYLIGGFNGLSWLSALDSFSPSLDLLTPLKPMNSARSYASAVALDGSIYVFGGGDGHLWYNTVECYNPRLDGWSLCPNLTHEKGSLGGATLNAKIYAMGGGDGTEIFCDVEMFDPALGKWINDQSMLQKRFAPAAAELNGVLYTVGGFDGKDYLKSAERFDPREAFWTNIASMSTRRGFHSAAVFNEKLYAIGGFDGEEMVSSVETYDPRMPSWVMAEPMSFSRGHAAAAVLSGSLFVIGGIKDEDNILDTIECYKEQGGWSNSGLGAIGRRCYCSAIVL